MHFVEFRDFETQHHQQEKMNPVLRYYFFR